MKTTQHTPALEAAKAINAKFEETHGIQLSRYEIASLIVQHYGNAHNELLEACKAAIVQIDEFIIADNPQHCEENACAVLQQLRAAITKAQSKGIAHPVH